MNYYEKQIERLQELLIKSIDSLSSIKSSMEQGKIIHAYNMIDDELDRSLCSMKHIMDSVVGNMKLDKNISEPIRESIIGFLVDYHEYNDNEGRGVTLDTLVPIEVYNDYIKDYTDMELVIEAYKVLGARKLYEIIKEHSNNKQ